MTLVGCGLRCETRAGALWAGKFETTLRLDTESGKLPHRNATLSRLIESRTDLYFPSELEVIGMCAGRRGSVRSATTILYLRPIQGCTATFQEKVVPTCRLLCLSDEGLVRAISSLSIEHGECKLEDVVRKQGPCRN